MASLIRHTAVWAGKPGLPGFSQFYHSVTDPPSTSAQTGHDAVRTFFADFLSYLPADLTITVDPIYQILEDTTGDVVEEGTVGTPSNVITGVSAGSWNAQVGLLVEWVTGTFVAGRRLRGRTYMVPLAGIDDTDGTLGADALAAARGAGAWIVQSAEDFRVWHRPAGAVPGSSASITGSTVRDHAAILRSRML